MTPTKLTPERMFHLLAENTTDMISLHELDTRLLFISPACQRILGYSPVELVGVIPLEWLHPQDSARVLNEFRPTLVKGKAVQSFDVRLRHKNGHYVWLEASIQPIMDGGRLPSQYMVVSRDITERKKAEQALRDSMEYNRALIRAIPDMLFVLDSAGIFLDFQAENVNNLVESPSSFIGKSVSTVLPLEVADKILAAIESAINTGEIQEFDYQIKHPELAEWMVYEVRLMYTGEDRILALVRDITSRKRSDEALREAQSQLAQQVQELEQRTTQITLLTEISNMLQTSITLEEAFEIIGQYGKRLFPNCAGVMMTSQISQGALKVVSAWGNIEKADQQYGRDDCWGIRRGRTFISQNMSDGLHCAHIDSDRVNRITGYLCVPIMAQGEVIGLLHVESLTEADPINETHRQIAEAFTEQLGLALSNLQLREKLREQVIHEPLTGLYNRYYMEESLERELYRAQRTQQMVGIIIMDLDHFKQLNTEFGHPNVDQMLRDFGDLLKRSVRGADIACRYGGDEFLVIMPEVTPEIAFRRAEQLRRQMAGLSVVGQGRAVRSVTVSVGVALWPLHGKDTMEVLQAADHALFSSKDQGGDRVTMAVAADSSRQDAEKNRHIIDQSDDPGLIGQKNGEFQI